MGLGWIPPPPIGGRGPVTPPVVAPTFPTNGTWVQNTNPTDIVAYVNLTGVTWTHLYINSETNGGVTTNAVDVISAISASSVTVLIPKNGWFMMNYSAGTPAWVWQGGL